MEKSLNVEIEFGELFFEELELCDHRVDEQIKGRILAAGGQALFRRLSERFGFRSPSRPWLAPISRLLSRRKVSRAIATALGASLGTAWAALL
jgi:hypothetical protein